MPKGKRYAKRTRRRPAWVGVLALLVVAAAGILRYLGGDWDTLLPARAGAPAASQAGMILSKFMLPVKIGAMRASPPQKSMSLKWTH